MKPLMRQALIWVTLCAFTTWLVVRTAGVQVGLLVALVAGVTLYLSMDVLLGRLVCRAIGRIPQAYRWSMDTVSVRPRWFGSGWSEVVISNWIWYNPPSFDDDDQVDEVQGFLLQIDEFKIRLRLSSIYGAAFHHGSLVIDLMRVQGLRFKTRRNRRGALNLWAALNLPDDDVNVTSFAQQARRYGGLHDDPEDETGSTAPAATCSGSADVAVMPLPPVATAATRAAAGYWRPEWGDREQVAAQPDAQPGHSKASTGRGFDRTRSPASRQPSLKEPLLAVNESVPGQYQEYPIGHPKRRPRWGVPLRFDIARVQLTEVQLWVLGLMLLDTHRVEQDSEKVQIDIHSVSITRKRLEAGDVRRAGSQDGVHGVYLGELVWVIVAEVVPLVLKKAPGRVAKNAAVAAGYLVSDGVKRVGARTLQGAHHVGHALKTAAHGLHRQGSPTPGEARGCRVCVHLIGGRQFTRKDRSVNVHAKLKLRDPSGRVVDEARSQPQMWTKVPAWDEHFELGPATSSKAALCVSCYHRKSRQVVGITLHQKETPERFMGDIVLPLSRMRIRDQVIAVGGEIVGWFPLGDPQGLCGDVVCTGQLKLGLQLLDAEFLEDDEDPHSTDNFVSDYAILHHPPPDTHLQMSQP